MERPHDPPQRPKRPVQQGLFGPLGQAPRKAPEVLPHPPDDAVRALAAALPAGLRLGTSSWAFPGWRGLVYAADADPRHLSRHGLRAYAAHPLLKTVGIDRTFYGPIAAADFRAYAAAVPDTFRFLVKAFGELTAPGLPGHRGPNPRYLDAASAVDLALAPACEGLGARLGPVVFQFPPQGAAITKRPEAFADRLHGFFAALPRGLQYAVELRDAALFTPRYAAALAAAGARHCYGVHPRMPGLARQRELAPPDGPVAVRWMLHGGLAYEQAKARYEPFDRLVDLDPDTRAEIAALCRMALAGGHEVTVVANNKAEGSAPQSLLALAAALAAGG